MKKLFYLVYTLFLLTISFYSVAQDQFVVRKGERPPIDLNTLPDDAYYPNRVLIKLKAETEAAITAQPHMSISDGEIIFGLPALDKLHHQINVTTTQQFFYSAALGRSFTDRHKAWGFHLWYEISFDSRISVKEVVAKYEQISEIEVVEPVYKKRLIAPVGEEVLLTAEANPSGTDWFPNDPFFDQQWHYHNTGQQGGTAGRDIDLPEAWELETGNSDVIVAIIDGGIQINHPDLAGNIWDGIGYNFVNNSNVILADNHGTHVAGTVAAVNNNMIGVAGIAGGSANNNGVSLMSCQVFTDDEQGGFHLAPIWAADNGASISQNSWGYLYVGVYNQVDLEAIDYFNTNGGGDALDGGITIFAAGNDYSSGQWYPGCYSGAFAIAATNNQDKKAWYSNYDTWVDISAPGGETNTVAARGVLSTLRNSTYGFYQGTSMACPHASGVAALMISMAYGLLSNEDVAEILRTTTDDHYDVNPNYIGKLGTGRLNALNALLETQNYLTDVTNPRSFKATGISTNTIELEWNLNPDNNNVLILWSADGTFGELQDGTTYNVGQAINGGGIVLYKGNNTEYTHNGLEANTKYFYKAFSFNAENTYSSGKITYAWTQCDILTELPYFQDFNESASLPNCWDVQDNQGNGQVWAFGTISGGLTGTTGNYAYLDSDGFGSGNTQNADLISPPFDFSNYIDIGIEFKHYFRSYSTSKASFHYSIDGGGSWTQVAIWTANNTSNPATFSITIEELSGQSNVLFKWNYTGTWGYYWCVDNVLIIGDNIAPGMPTVATNPDPANDALNIAVDGTLNWNWGNNTDKYDLWFGAKGNMQLVVSQAAAGDIGTNGSFTYNNLLFNSSYQWKVVSYNTQIGMQVEGPVWEFKTEFGIVDLPFTEDFEAVFPPLGWTIYDVDGAPEVRTWVASTAQNHTPGGNRSAFHDYGPSSQTEDGWLVTPKLALPANSEIELNFWNYNTFPGWYYKNSVLISTGDGTPQTGNFVELWSPASVTASWVQTSIDLSAYAGQDAYIAFRYQGSNAHAWYVDDVSVTAEQFIPALTVTPPNQNVTAPAGLTSFTVTSNTAWDVGSDQGWCTATPSGDGNGTITVNFTENTSINIRIATLTVTAAGVDPVLVTVTQAGRVPEPIADVILRPQQMDISDASSRSAVLVKISDYPTDDVRYRLYNGANQYNCWDGTQYVLSNSYALSPLVPGDPTNEIIWWIMFERGNNASVSANYRDRLGPTYAVNHLTISLPDTDPIVNSFTISETLPLNEVYPLNESYVVLGFDSQIGGNLISATASDLATGEFELIVSTATVIRRLEVRNQLNVLIEEVTGVWEAQNDPQVFDFSGGGTYCAVNLPSGVQALLSGSEVGVDYQLLKDGNPFGEIEPGTGNPIVWYDLEAGSYTVEADNGAITIFMNGTVSVTADEALPVSVTIVADQMSVCQGQTVTFTAVPENEGDNPTYQWLVNTIPAGNNHAVFSYIPEAGDQVQLIMTSSLNCVSNSPAWSNSIAAEVLPMVNASVSFTADQNNVCQGTEVEFVAVAIHGGQEPVYQWYVNGTQSGQNSAIFSYIPSNGDLVELSMTSSETCVAVNPVTADPITMNVTPLAVVSVSVNADANPVCSGSGVTLTALPTHPGSMPVYQWFVNDLPVGANSATYTYIPLDNDKVQVELTSNQACATDNPAYSEPIIIQLTEAINASVSIVADIPTPCQGQTVTFTALPENGGADPSFQWFVNNNPAGINSPVFSYDPLDGDLIGLSMTSSLGCVTVNPVYDELPPLIVTPVIVELMASPASAGMVSMSGEAHIGQTVQLTATALDGWEFINWTDTDNQVVSETAVFDLILTACSQSYIAHFGSQTNISGKLVFFNDSETEVVSPYSNGSFMVQLFDEDIPLSPPQQVKQDEPFVFHGLEEQKQYSLRFWDQSNNNLLHSTWGWNNWGSVTAIDALLISHMTTGNPIILNFPWITTTTVDKLSPFAFQLADVNSSHSLSSVDMLLVMFRSVGRPDVAPFPGGKPNFLPFVHPVANLNNLTYPENPTIDFQQFGTYASTSAANSVYHMAELPSLNQGTNYFKLYLVPVGDLNASFMAQSGNKSQTMLLADQQLSLTDAYPKTIPVIINSYAEVGAFNLNLKYDPTQLHIKQLHDYEVYYDQPELGLLSVAFLNEQGKTFWPGDTLMLIDVEVNKALDLSELPFSLTGENIWADVNVQEIDEIVLTIPVLKSESVLIANAKEPQLMIYPNPFVQQTIMRVTVPETATIQLRIYNNLGKMVAVKQWEQSGSKNIEIHGDILPGSGVYSFEAIITSAEKTWLKTNKIIYLGH